MEAKTAQQLTFAIRRMATHIESYDRVVGSIFLNRLDVDILRQHQDFDSYGEREVQMLLSIEYGAPFMGRLYGAYVFQSDMVPEWHAIILQDGIRMKIIDQVAALPLGDI